MTGRTNVHHVILSGSPCTKLTNAFANTMFTFILSATYFATAMTYFLHSMPLLHLLMPRRSEHTTVFATSFLLDLHTLPFALKQGIPTRQSIQLIDGLYRFKKSIPSVTSLCNPSSTYSCNDTVTWRSPSPAINVKSNICTS